MEYEVLVKETGEIIEIEHITNLQQLKAALAAELEEEAAGFVRIGYLLKRAKETNMFAEEGYENIYDFAKETYGLDRSTVSRFMAINDRYSMGGNSPYIDERYKGFGRTKLQEMLTIPDVLAEEIRPETTKREIQELKKEIREEEKEKKEEQKTAESIENTTREEDSEKQNLKQKLEENTRELEENTQKTNNNCESTQNEEEKEEETRVAPVQQTIENTKAEHDSGEQKNALETVIKKQLETVIEKLFEKDEWKEKMTEINKAVWNWKKTKDQEELEVAISKTGYAHARVKRAYIFFHTVEEGITITRGADKTNITYQEFAEIYDKVFGPAEGEEGEETYKRFYGEEETEEIRTEPEEEKKEEQEKEKTEETKEENETEQRQQSEQDKEKEEHENIPGQMQINDYEECVPEELKEEKKEAEEKSEEPETEQMKQSEQEEVRMAIETLEKTKEESWRTTPIPWKKAIQIATSAMKREIPAKVKTEQKGIIRTYHYCENCWCDVDKKYTYCWNCGKKLEWSKEEDL